MQKARATLWEAVGLGLIVEWPSGIVFSNQTGGTACLQPGQEGFYVPLRNDIALLDKQLMQPELSLIDYFLEEKHKGTGAVFGLDQHDAAFITSVLDIWNLSGCIHVDHTRLRESHEAWVYVTVERSEGEPPLCIFDFPPYPRRGVLTWSNSD